MEQIRYYRTFLKEEFDRRRATNPRFSLRGFARLLEFDHSGLSRVLSGKQSLSIGAATEMADRLQLGEPDRRIFLSSVIEEKAVSGQFVVRLDPSIGLDRRDSLENARQVEQDSFAIISEWRHYAILELTNVRGFDSSPSWISRQLGLSQNETREAIDRLLRMGLLIRTSKDRLKKTCVWVEVADHTRTAQAMKAHQAQFLEKSAAALRDVPLEQRAHYTSMVALDPSKLPRAKELIRKFTEEMNQLVTAPHPQEVYWLGISLVPLTQIEETPEGQTDEIPKKTG